MPFVSANYATNPDAPAGRWVCTRTSAHGPYTAHPPVDQRHNPDFCGQCVSDVTTVCPTLPVNTGKWKKGVPIKGSTTIVEGTAIATFDQNGIYVGHAAIDVRQDDAGIHVYDQWITGAGKAVGPCLIRWDGTGVSNRVDGFHVIEN